MLFTSPVYSQASGSIAGITYSHNRGGMYTRARVTPTDPSSTRQQFMRSAMATLAAYWGNTLTSVQRAAWNLYGANVPWLNPLGQTIFLTGQQHFNRCNTVRLQANLTIIAAAPTIFDLGTFTPPAIAEVNDIPEFEISFTPADDWASNAGGYMSIFPGKAIGPGRGFYRGPWRRSGLIVGDAAPPASPYVYASPWPWSVDNLAWIQCRIIQVDGRLSLPIILGPSTIIAGP